MKLVGYARVSTHDQDLALQHDALRAAGCESVHDDHGLSGRAANRPGLAAALADCAAGDVLVAWKLDRLGRSNVLFGGWSVVREWGRVGQPGMVRTDWYGTEEEAAAARVRLAAQKARLRFVEGSAADPLVEERLDQSRLPYAGQAGEADRCSRGREQRAQLLYALTC